LKSYGYLADVYDKFMADVDYKMWAQYLHGILSENGAERLLETACGTGNVTFELAKYGYDITAADSSVEMLSIAKSKNAVQSAGVRFVRQDMRSLEAGRKFDAVLSACDGANYLCAEGLQSFLSSAYAALKKSGVLLFDISSERKLKKTLDGNSFFDEDNDTVCIWKNRFDENEKALYMDVTIFKKQGDMYERFDETHTQYAHSADFVLASAKEAGFAQTHVYDCFTRRKPDSSSQRLQFVCFKI